MTSVIPKTQNSWIIDEKHDFINFNRAYYYGTGPNHPTHTLKQPAQPFWLNLHIFDNCQFILEILDETGSQMTS